MTLKLARKFNCRSSFEAPASSKNSNRQGDCFLGPLPIAQAWHRLYVRPAICFAIENRTGQCIASFCAYDRAREAEQHEELSESNTACRDALDHGHGNQCAGFRWNRDCPATASPGCCGCTRKASS